MLSKFTAIVLSLTMLTSIGGLKNEPKKLSGRENYYNSEVNFADKAMDYLETLCNDYNDRGDTPFSDRKACRKFIVSELIEAGYDKSQIKEQPVFAGPVYMGRNVVLTVEGKNPDKLIIAGAHYDGEGAGDNGSGVALLLANAVGLANYKLPYTVKYVFFDCEEIGMWGAKAFAKSLTKEEVKNTAFMINIDSIAFGDYCNIYGGVTSDDGKKATATGAYELAMAKAKALGYNVFDTKKLDGYYAKNGKGPKPDKNGVYTNPWTYNNPAPDNMAAVSPSQLSGVSDHSAFAKLGIEYIYFEATNWYAKGDGGHNAYTGYFETTDDTIGNKGMFMNTKYDTIENLEKYFPGRMMDHFNIYSRILSALLINPTK